MRGSGSPEGIRTLVADLRSQSPRPLDDGAALFTCTSSCCGAFTALGYQDSNLDSLNQNQKGCQLPHTPKPFGLVSKDTLSQGVKETPGCGQATDLCLVIP